MAANKIFLVKVFFKVLKLYVLKKKDYLKICPFCSVSTSWVVR